MYRLKRHAKSLRGDTIIEVIFAITVFCAVAVISIALMNQGVSSAQASLEVTLTRNEMDTQAEALRFVHSNYIAELTTTDDTAPFTDLWTRMTENASTDFVPSASTGTCTNVADIPDNAFILNARKLDGLTSYVGKSGIAVSEVYPRILYSVTTSSDANTDNKLDDTSYTTVKVAEGIWIIPVLGKDKTFYDFHIRTCWHAPGKNVPYTIDTIVRLYNPKGLL